MNQVTKQQWESIQDWIKSQIGEESYKSWVMPLSFNASETISGKVTLNIPTRFMRDWVVNHYSDVITRSIEQVCPTPFELNFLVDGGAASAATNQPTKTKKPEENSEAASGGQPDMFDDLFSSIKDEVEAMAGEEPEQTSPSLSAENEASNQGMSASIVIADPEEAPRARPSPQPMPSANGGSVRAEDLQRFTSKPNASAAQAPNMYEGNPLDPRFTFDNFVTGKSNEFAYAAAKRIAESDDLNYNPFFLYGGVGLGKTHLMHAAAWRILELFPNRKIMYISAEKFLNNFVRAIRDKNTAAFQQTFRSVDVLMIDDVQFIAGKEATQEEFFHTFNALINDGKQIILTADQSPHEMRSIEDRLRSRLGWGLATEIHKPSLETRMAILQQKAQGLGIEISKEVNMFLADKIDSNVRELEGALNRLAAHATLVQTDITVESAYEILRDLFRMYDRVVTLDEIKKKVAEFYSIKVSDMTSSRRMRTVARPRQIAMYLSKILTKKSFPEIGKDFGGRDHTTVMHAAKTVEKLCAEDPSLKEDVTLLEKMLKGE